jgi:hypothetical protein
MISRLLFLVFMVYLVIEGALRKWVWPGASNELFVVKDLLLILTVVGLYAFDRDRVRQPVRYTAFELGLFQLWVVIALIAAAAGGFGLTELIGLRYYLIPLLILIVFPAVVVDVWTLETLSRRYLLICGVVTVLGFMQFASPPDAFINRYSWAPSSEIDVATFGEAAGRYGEAHVRITGTFSYISPYAAYLQFMFFLALASFVIARTEVVRVLSAILLVAILANLFMTGSRGPVITCLVLSVLFLPELRLALGARWGFIGIAFSLTVVLLAAATLGDLASAIIERNEEAGDASGRIAGSLLLPFYTLEQSPFWGDGLGASFLGLGQLRGTGGFEYRFDEITQDRLAIEVGILGYIFLLVFKVYFLITTWRLARKAKRSEVRLWAMASFAYQASLLWTIPLYNSVAAIAYFLCIAVSVWLRNLQGRELSREAFAPGRDSPPHARP